MVTYFLLVFLGGVETFGRGRESLIFPLCGTQVKFGWWYGFWTVGCRW